MTEPIPTDLLRAIVHTTADVGDRLVIIGCGYVSRATQQILLDIGVSPDAVTVVDAVAERLKGAPMVEAGCTAEVATLTPDSLAGHLDWLLEPGDVLVNLTYDVATEDVLTWCAEHGVTSVDTSVELWDPYDDWHAPPARRTLAQRHGWLRATMRARLEGLERVPTMLVEHGANPGWVSHATRAAIDWLAQRRADADHRAAAAINYASREGDYAAAARALGVRVITIAERDTQTSDLQREPGEFVNTWSIDGFRSEGGAPAAAWLGSHDFLPDDWRWARPDRQGLQRDRSVYGPRAGMETLVRTWVPPHGQQLGFPIDHGELLSIGRSLTCDSPTSDIGIYSPTVFYGYLPCDDAVASIHDLRGRSYELDRDRMRIMTDDITDGADYLGVLVMTDQGGVWHGSTLDIAQTRELVGAGHNATTLQVAGSVVAAVGWAISHPHRGLVVPDDIAEHAEVLATAAQWLGDMPFVPVSWTPADGPSTPSSSTPPDSDALELASFLI